MSLYHANLRLLSTDHDEDVMKEDEIENIRKSLKTKTANKPRSKKRNAARVVSAVANAKTALPESGDGVSDSIPGMSAVEAPAPDPIANGHLPPSSPGGTPILAPSHDMTHGDTKGLLSDGQASCGAEVLEDDVISMRAEEVKADFADSDDEIPLPPGLPAFQDLEDAMLVRDLKKDRLPGRIIRASAGGGKTVSIPPYIVTPI